MRKGFVHRGIAVLPRQTCGLYTKNTHYDDYPNGGPKILEQSIRGGELFQTLVYNPVIVLINFELNQ
jgi:heparan sulfate N-deacetylase/N-sulfotransferase NDST2